MILVQSEKALQDFIETQMNYVVGHGNSEIPVFIAGFQDMQKIKRNGVVMRTNVAINVAIELREGHESVSDLEPLAFRTTVRHPLKIESLKLARNLDYQFDRVVTKNLNDDIQMMICRRNAGPEWFMGDTDKLHYYTMLYTSVFRNRGNDG